MTSLLVVVTYVLMIVVNIMANALPINDVTTGAVSDAYENLFAPAGATFSIWLLIYLLLFSYTVYQLNCFKDISHSSKRLFKSIGLWFSLSSIFNSLWIFAWHYDFIGLSLLLMLLILASLIRINLIIRQASFTHKDQYFIKLPFQVYFGWITVATIANVTVFLVKLGWGGFGLSDVFWACFVILLGAFIGSYNIMFYKAPAYGGVIVWAYAGIILKHMSPSAYNGQYTEVIIAAALGILLILGVEFLVYRKAKDDRIK